MKRGQFLRSLLAIPGLLEVAALLNGPGSLSNPIVWGSGPIKDGDWYTIVLNDGMKVTMRYLEIFDKPSPINMSFSGVTWLNCDDSPLIKTLSHNDKIWIPHETE